MIEGQGKYNPCPINNSKNMTCADNQQERLIKIGWIVGFVDGEGCFSINFIKQNDKKEKNRLRRGYRTGYQVMHEFVVTQGEKSLDSLKYMQRYFNVGNMHPYKRYDNHKEILYRYVVRKREDIIKTIIPFFEKYNLQTSKQDDFRKFVQCMKLIEKNKHLTKNGLLKIVKITNSMNRKKSRTELIRILRD